MPLFQINPESRLHRLNPGSFPLEKHLQKLVEANLQTIFGVDFIASEYVIRGEQSGRIDTLGIDSDGSPTVIEYKLKENSSVINQGLFYINWLLEHRGDFTLTARDVLGSGLTSTGTIRA